MGTPHKEKTRTAKRGVKRYLMSRLRAVREILRKDDDQKKLDELAHTQEPTDEVRIPVVSEPQEAPPPLPDLPPLPTADTSASTDTTPNPAYKVATSESSLPYETTNSYGNRIWKWTRSPMRRVRKILEICTWTMLISTVALERSDKWQVCTPVSIEHGFDLLKSADRKRAKEYIYSEKPDLICGEWMCGPYSSMQKVNLAKGGETRNKILRDQREHAKVSAFISTLATNR